MTTPRSSPARRVAGVPGVLAVQMPDNWSEPSHRIPAAVLAEGDFSDVSREALITERVASPTDYRRWLGADLERHVDDDLPPGASRN